MSFLANCCRAAAAWSALVLCAAPAVAADSTATLVVASQASLSDRGTVNLVFSTALDPASASLASNYAFTPARTVTAASVDPALPNLVRLSLASTQPLQPGANYALQVLGGRDAQGNDLVPVHTSATLRARSLQSEIDNILACQLPDGAFSTNIIGDLAWRPNEPIWIVPYHACAAVDGLLQAYRISRDPRILPAVRAYLVWHMAHLQADGTITDFTGYYPTYQSTGDYDSSDSYAALLLVAFWQYYQESRDTAFLSANYGSIQKAVSAIDLTLQSDMLTWAKPSYHVKYTMDNSEVFQGYFAAARLAKAAGNIPEHTAWLSKANAVRNAIHNILYIATSGEKRYAIARSNAGNILSSWSKYYPDAMANEFALLYTHDPSDARFAEAWQTEKSRFFAGGVPDGSTGWSAALLAQRASDRAYRDIAYARTLKNHASPEYAHISGRLLQIESEARPLRVAVPSTKGAAVAIDGKLDEPVWISAAKLHVHKFGTMAGFANEETYEFPANTADPDGLYTLYVLNNGTRLFIGLDAQDKSITSANIAGDSDGLSHLYIRNAANPDYLHDVSYTFFPDAGIATVPTVPAGSALGNGGSAAFSFKGSANTPNTPADADTGFQMEFEIDLAHAAFGGYAIGVQKVLFGLRIADMDGTPGQPWPWSNGAFGTMYQLAAGLYPADYSNNELHLIDPATYSSAVEDWSLYGASHETGGNRP